jgi:hypothetical protein
MLINYLKIIFSFRITYILLLFILLLGACTRDVSFDLPDIEEKLVVEGKIETGLPPIIILTKNSNYYGSTNLSDLNSYFVHNAIIKVSDGIDTVQLTELTFDSAGVEIGVYTDLTGTFIGMPNQTYYLWIQAEGKSISSITSIPATVPLDSIYIEEGFDVNRPNIARLVCRYTDPPEFGNRVRAFTKRNKEPYLADFNSVFDDKLINGTTFDFPLSRAIDRTDSLSNEDYPFFYKGDTISVKWCNIDQKSFDFWRTLEFEINSGGPFSSPIEIQGNITGGLGIWAGYNATYKTVIAP